VSDRAPQPIPDHPRHPPPTHGALLARVQALLPRDARRLGAALAKLKDAARGEGGPPPAHALDSFLTDLTRAETRLADRVKALPKPTFDLDLPILARRDEIAAAIAAHQVVVICGETGSGKTTQLPKICLSLGRGVRGLIGHTQPRRIAARTVAQRIAAELAAPLGRGGPVGYKVRFTDETSPSTYVKLMTDGILLAETQGAGAGGGGGGADRDLLAYDTIIIDEAHERSLNIDFLLGYLKRLLPRRPDLKLIITSATIDPQRFSDHFDGAPIIEVSGRTYPVEVRYRPLTGADEDEQDFSQEEAILAATDELLDPGSGHPGDILVFLHGEREIRETAQDLREHLAAGGGRRGAYEVLPLYARLPAPEQQRIFQPPSPPHARRIVLATNVAETSLTVPNIGSVIDTGLARISRYSPRIKVQRLPVEPISQASAQQRSGRCGRVRSGVCIRLYAEDDFEKRPKFTEPEIRRTNLASVVLQMKALRLGRVEQFPFIDPPESRAIRDAYDTLLELGAVDHDDEITELGRTLARLPVDPRIARMVFAGRDHTCLGAMLVIASALSVQDPRERPFEAQQKADELHKRFNNEDSDFVAILNLWKFFQEQSRALSGSKFRKLCKDNMLSFVRLREWADVHEQLSDMAEDLGWPSPPPDSAFINADGYEPVHRAILAGLLSNVGRRKDDGGAGDFAGARGVRFNIHPASALYKKGPKWVVAGELVKTTKLYARAVARVQPDWIEAAAQHVVKKSYAEPYFREESQTVVASERVSLYGLELVANRTVNFGTIDPILARDIFIRDALVAGRLRTNAPFLQFNMDLVGRVRAEEAKLRRRDLLGDEILRTDFYDRRVPMDVHSGPLFEKWRRRVDRDKPGLLFMTREHIVSPTAPPAPTAADYPDALDVSGHACRLIYVNEPGSTLDGVTINLPLATLPLARAEDFEWLVPGLLREKIIALIKTLPKETRAALVPVPDTADKALDLIRRAGPLVPAVADAVVGATGVEIEARDFNPVELPDYLRMRFRVIDEAGNEIDGGTGRDLDAIRTRLKDRLARLFAELPPSNANRRPVRKWDFGDLPDSLEITVGGLGPMSGVRLRGFPALAVVTSGGGVGGGGGGGSGGGVEIRLFESDERAALEHRRGVLRLLAIESRDDVMYYLRGRPALDRLNVAYSTLGTPAELLSELRDLIADRAFAQGPGDAIAPSPRTQTAFRAMLSAGAPRIERAVKEVCDLADTVLHAHHRLLIRLGKAMPPGTQVAAADIRFQVSQLMNPRFLTTTPYRRLAEFPRYFAAIHARLDKLERGAGGVLERDLKGTQQVVALWNQYAARRADELGQGIHNGALEDYRWLLEEYRVALYAQELGTSVPVSPQRLERLWVQASETTVR
jgi:ATP-dependent helicase HrpA